MFSSFGSALCSGTEAAFLAVNPFRVHELAARATPSSSARKLAKLRRKLGRTLTVLVIANNGFNIFGSLMLGGMAAFVFEQKNISAIALPIFSASLTILVILVGEILPKSFGSKFALQVSLASAPILHLLGLIMKPLLNLIEKIIPVITAENELNTDEEEIRQMARIGLLDKHYYFCV